MQTSVETVQQLLEAANFTGKNWDISPFGAGRFSETFRIAADHDSYIMRIAPPDDMRLLFYEYRMMRQEPGLHKIIREQTDIPVPEIIYYDFSRQLIDRDYLIMPEIPGKPLSEASLDMKEQQKALYQWGDYVRKLHTITDPYNRFGYLGEHYCMEPQNTWKDAFRMMYRKELEDIQQTGIYDRETVDYAMQLLDDNLHVFESPQASHLCHGDLWVTNLLVDNTGEVQALIDFDRACWGDIEWDLAIADYCGITQSSFWKGYGQKIEAKEGDAALRKFFYILYEHQKYIVIAMSQRRNDPSGAKRYAEQSLSIMKDFENTGVPRL